MAAMMSFHTEKCCQLMSADAASSPQHLLHLPAAAYAAGCLSAILSTVRDQ